MEAMLVAIRERLIKILAGKGLSVIANVWVEDGKIATLGKGILSNSMFYRSSVVVLRKGKPLGPPPVDAPMGIWHEKSAEELQET